MAGCRYVKPDRSGRDLRELLCVGIENRDSQGRNSDSGPLGGNAYSNRFTSPSRRPVGDLSRISKSAAIWDLPRDPRRDQVQRSAALPALEVKSERERVTHAKLGRVHGRCQAIIANSAAERRGHGRGTWPTSSGTAGATATSRARCKYFLPFPPRTTLSRLPAQVRRFPTSRR